MAVRTIFSPTSSVGSCSAWGNVMVMEANTSSARPRQSKPAPRFALVAGTRTVMAVASMVLPGGGLLRSVDDTRGPAKGRRAASPGPACAARSGQAGAQEGRLQRRAERFDAAPRHRQRCPPLGLGGVELGNLVREWRRRPDDHEVGPALIGPRLLLGRRRTGAVDATRLDSCRPKEQLQLPVLDGRPTNDKQFRTAVAAQFRREEQG